MPHGTRKPAQSRSRDNARRRRCRRPPRNGVCFGGAPVRRFNARGSATRSLHSTRRGGGDNDAHRSRRGVGIAAPPHVIGDVGPNLRRTNTARKAGGLRDVLQRRSRTWNLLLATALMRA